ncbi:DnaB-like helicase N-terminal domain-containing protein [Streptomyces sp. NBC_00847]|uniref:DnaB-like helicase N-terminal domain-containing protein n=1 Tax=Streptomyces sp. NBC_00847 TaxID=2975850 RepID=UPI00225E65D8|nr:DnaB-like helicase N-terminal domain-containing protein [Streptomyces sp. NBC_00847]MCX4885998.1 DNA helicase [Streptomyces sp. NBC_00847]
MKRLTHRAEEALLGAMLFRPQALPQMRWIPPGTFSRPDHAALWGVLHSIDFTKVAPNDVPAAISAAVAKIEDQGIRQLLSPSRVSGLVDPGVCPDPSRAPLYGGMVLESAIHRAVEHAGEQLRDTARQAEVDQARKALEHADRTGQRLAQLDAAWKSAPETVRNLLDTQPEQPVTPVPRTERARVDLQAEAETVASLLAEPRQLAEVPWLHDRDFTHPELKAVYRAMRTLDDRHAPIDPLTVAWEAQRHPGVQPSDQVLAELQHGGNPGHAAFTGEQVLNTAALDRMDAAGHDIRNYSRHPSLAPGVLVDHAGQALEPCHADHERVQAAEREPELADTEPAPPAPAEPHHAPDPQHEMEIDQ